MQTCKNYLFFSLFLCTLLISGCKKTLAQKDEAILSVTSNSRVVSPVTPWGVVINTSSSTLLGASDPLQQNILTPANKIALALDYGVRFIRTELTKDEWETSRSGFFYTYTNFVNNGFRIVLNITWEEPTPSEGSFIPVPFPSDADNPSSPYYKFVQEVIDSLTSNGRTPPAVVVVENEEPNKNYHVLVDTNDSRKYLLMVNAVTSICHAKGIKVANGGLTLRGLTFATWDWLKNVKGRATEAQIFAKNSMPPSAYYTLYPPRPANIKSIGILNINNQIAMINYFTSNYKTSDLDYINFHWYEPAIVRGWIDLNNGGSAWSQGISKNDTSAGAMDNVLKYLTSIKGTRKIISNEIGQLTQSDCLTRKIMNKVAARPYNAFEMALWYDGDGDNEYEPKALHNTFILAPFYTIRNTGITFKRLISDPAANPSCTPLQ